MPKITSKASATLSMALAILFFIGLIAGAILLPAYLEAVTGAGVGEDWGGEARAIILALAYGVLALAAAADVQLILLLRRVWREEVFTGPSVALIRGISWCCIIAGGLFLWLGMYFLIAFAVAFVAVLVGICLRVVKNVIETAMEIKSENDLTV